MDENLVRLAGLRGTTWWADTLAMSRPDAAVGYVWSDREDVLSPEPTFRREGQSSPVWLKWPIGAGGIVSTVGDLSQWWHAIASGMVLSPDLSREMLTRRDTSGSQGYGWTVAPRGSLGLRIYRGGSRTGYTSMLAAYPDRQALIVFAINQSAESQWAGLVWRTLERFLSGQRDSLPPPTVRLERAEIKTFAGLFALPTGGKIRVIDEDGDLLVGAESQSAVDALGCAPEFEAVRRANESSMRVLTGFIHSTADTSLFPASQRGEFRQWLSGRIPPDSERSLEVLGAALHASARGRVQTFVRLGGTGAPVLRLIWEGEQLLAWGDGIRLPCLRRFRPTSTATAASFSPRDATWATLRLERRPTGDGLVVRLPGAAETAPAQRIDRD